MTQKELPAIHFGELLMDAIGGLELRIGSLQERQVAAENSGDYAKGEELWLLAEELKDRKERYRTAMIGEAFAWTSNI